MRLTTHIPGRRLPWWRASGWRLLWAFLACTLTSVAQAQQVVPISHPGQSLAEINPGRLRAMFAQQVEHWPDGTPVRVFVLADDHPLHRRFCTEALHTYPYVLRRSWDTLVFSGTGFAPTTVQRPEILRQKVMETPGALGYALTERAAQETEEHEQVPR